MLCATSAVLQAQWVEEGRRAVLQAQWVEEGKEGNGARQNFRTGRGFYYIVDEDGAGNDDGVWTSAGWSQRNLAWGTLETPLLAATSGIRITCNSTYTTTS